MKEKLTEKQALEKALANAGTYLTAAQIIKVLEFIALMPTESETKTNADEKQK